MFKERIPRFRVNGQDHKNTSAVIADGYGLFGNSYDSLRTRVQ